MTFADSPASTCAPGSPDGNSPCSSPAGQTTSPCGPQVSRASRSAPPVVEPEQTTLDIFGPRAPASSASADLQRSLASRLKGLLDCDGSMEYSMTWKDADTPAGRRLCRLRASGRRISDTGSGGGVSGWTTPQAHDAKGMGSADRLNRHGTKHGCSNLQDQAHLAGWATPRSTDERGSHARGNPDRALKNKGRLEDQCYLAGWPTPASSDAKRGCDPNRTGGRSRVLNNYAALAGEPPKAGWPTPTAKDADRGTMPPRPHDTGVARTQRVQQIVGWPTPQARDWRSGKASPETAAKNYRPLNETALTANGSPALTGSGAALNPEFSRSLMMFPAEWSSCAPTATQLSHPSQQRLL